MEPVTGGAAEALRARTVAIVKHAHTPTGGAEDFLRAYLEERAAVCAMLAHPFPDARGVPPYSHWRVHRRDGGAEERFGWRGRGPAVCWYLRDALETLRRFLFVREPWDVYVGVDNLNATVGIVLRALGRVRTVVYYVIDYVPRRFDSALLNRLYHALDRFAARRADCVWNVGSRMAAARAERGLPPDRAAPQLVVPLGAPLPERDAPKADAPTAVFLGHLSGEQGLELLLDAWVRVRETVPDARLRVVGSGELWAALEARARALGIADAVDWRGFVPEGALHDALTDAWVAVAPYPGAAGSYKAFADPGKLRWYCAAGLPVVVTDVPAAAGELERTGCALVPAPEPMALAGALAALLEDAPARARMGEAARRLARGYTWETIFDAAWAATWPHLEQRWARG